jgi:putative hydrolase of the HAD superfamily
MFEELDITNNFELAKNYNEIYWNIFINNMNLDNEALLFLQKCQNLKINICIVTDMTAIIQIKKLQKLNVVKYIKYLVTSEEVGIEKPNHKIFQTALNKLNLSSQEVIMIGDNEEKDIKGAQFLGIKSYKILIKNSNNVEFAKK